MCTHSCEQNPCGTGTPRTTQLMGRTNISHRSMWGSSTSLLSPSSLPICPAQHTPGVKIHWHLTPPTAGPQGSRQSSFPAPVLVGPEMLRRAAMMSDLPQQLCSSPHPKNEHFSKAKPRQAQAEQAADTAQPQAVTHHVTAPLPTGRDTGQLNYLRDPSG